MSRDGRHVALICSEEYAPHAGAMLASLVGQHPDGSLTLHFVPGPGMSAQNLERLGSIADRAGQQLHVHHIPPELTAGLPVLGRIGEIGWYRMLLGALLPELDRILYLDVDAVVTDSLSPLFEVDLGDRVAVAIENAYLPQRRADFARLGLDPADGYINTGVLLLNLERLRNGAAEAMFDRGHRDKALIEMAEQDVINMEFGDQILRVHPRWNCQNALFLFREGTEEVFGRSVVEEAVQNPAVIHFEGPGSCKPWHYLCDHPLRHLYLDHLASTPWKTPPIEGRTAKNMLKRMIGRTG